MRWLATLLILLLAFPDGLAQSGTGLLANGRMPPAASWAGVGAGAIPARTTICTTLGLAGQASGYAQSVTMANIESALSSCPANETVLLNPGTYSDTNSLVTTASNVTLRGSGPTQTILKYTGTSSNGLGIGPVAMWLSNGDSNALSGTSNFCSWTAGFSQGTTVLTAGTCSAGSLSNMHVGTLLMLSQNDDASDTGDMFINGSTTYSQQGDGGNVISGQAQTQLVTVTACNNTGNTYGQVCNLSSITISQGLYAPNWSSGKSPKMSFSSSLPMSNFGLENLAVDTTSITTSGAAAMVQFGWATYSWVKNVSLINNTGNADSMHKHVWVAVSNHMTVRDSYMYGASPSSEGYGVDFWQSSDNLAENDICQHLPTCEIMEGGTGNVFGYDYAVDNFYNGGLNPSTHIPYSPNWQQCDQFHHNAGDYYNLWEGGIGICHTEDAIHGTAFANTTFRNALSGFDPAQTPSGAFGVGSPVAKSANTLTVNGMAYARYPNFILNVLGYGGAASSFSYIMSSATDCGSGNNGMVFAFDDSDQNVSAYPPFTACPGSVTLDNDVTANARPSASAMLCGNWDAVTAGIRTCQTASSASTYPGLSSPSTTWSSFKSLYLASQPTWWVFPSGTSGTPWPGIGPDVTGGNISGTAGHAYLNPAANCYLNKLGGATDGSTGSLQSTFDASVCYPASSPSPGISTSFKLGTASR